MKPFRWDIRRREQLGGLVAGDQSQAYADFLVELRDCSVRVLAATGDSDLVFIGRSPESIFDYLSGILRPTSWSERLALVNLSLRGQSLDGDEISRPVAFDAFRQHLSMQGLSPGKIVSNQRPIAIIDLVSSGSTYERLMELLTGWAEIQRIDRAAMRRRLRFVGVTWKSKPSPNTWRWQQHASWLQSYPRIVAKNVSIPASLWGYLGNTQAKVSQSHPPWRWADSQVSKPPRNQESLEALRLALRVLEHGDHRDERESFASELSAQHAMRERWCRKLVGELRGLVG